MIKLLLIWYHLTNLEHYNLYNYVLFYQTLVGPKCFLVHYLIQQYDYNQKL